MLFLNLLLNTSRSRECFKILDLLKQNHAHLYFWIKMNPQPTSITMRNPLTFQEILKNLLTDQEDSAMSMRLKMSHLNRFQIFQPGKLHKVNKQHELVRMKPWILLRAEKAQKILIEFNLALLLQAVGRQDRVQLGQGKLTVRKISQFRSNI